VNTWFKSLLAAAVTGAAHGATAVLSAIVIAPQSFNLTGELISTLKLALSSGVVGAAVSVAAYLQKSPVPE
jgi:hypothetical protein